MIKKITGILMMTMILTTAIGAAEPEPRRVTMTVKVEENFQADVAILTIGVEKKEKNFERATEEVLKSMNACATVLKALGIREENIKYQKFVHSPENNWFGESVVAKSGLTIRIDESTNIAPVLKALSAMDKSINVQSITYELSNPGETDAVLIQKAALQASQKKKSIEGAMAIKLNIASIRENHFFQPVMGKRLFATAMNAGAQESEPLYLPTPEIQKTLQWTLEYDIKDQDQQEL